MSILCPISPPPQTPVPAQGPTSRSRTRPSVQTDYGSAGEVRLPSDVCAHQQSHPPAPLHALWATTDVPQCNLVPILVITGVLTSNVAAAEVRKRRTLKVQCAWQETIRCELCHVELLLGIPGEVELWQIGGEKAQNIAHLLSGWTALIAEVPEWNIGWPADQDDTVPDHNLVSEEL